MRENAFVEAWKTQHRRVSMILGLTLLCAPSAISVYADPNIDKTQIKHYVVKWYVMTTLTSRYITSPETVMDMDIKRIKERGLWLD